MQAHESTPLSRLVGLAVAVVLLLGLMLQAAPGALGQGFKDDDGDDVDNPYEDAGIIDFREYQSPNWGWSVEWEDGWDLDTSYDPPVTTDEEAQRDQLHLAWTGEEGLAAYVTIQGAPADADEPADEIEHWTDPDWIERNWESFYEVTPVLTHDDDDSAEVVYAIVNTRTDELYVTMFETLVVNGDWVYITFTAHEDALEPAFEAVADGLALNGDQILTGIAWDEIEDAVADAA